MSLGRHHSALRCLVLVAVAASAAATLHAAEGVEASGAFVRHPVKELSDAPGPVYLGKDFVLIGVARRDDDFFRENFGLRRFAFDGKEGIDFGDAANTPPYLPRGGRRLGNYFHDLAGKLDTATSRSSRNYPNRLVPLTDGWLVAGRVGGDEGKIIPAMLKLNSDGGVDADFAKSGRAVLPPRNRSQGVTAAALLGKDKEKRVWLGMPSAQGFSIAKVDEKGAIDTTFGDDGVALLRLDGYDTCWPQTILPSERGGATIFGCGSVKGKQHLIIARVSSAGKLDTETFGGDRGKGGWTIVKQARCDTWTAPPRYPSAVNYYYFSADTWAVSVLGGATVVALDGDDAVDDQDDPVVGARKLSWRRGVAGLLRLGADGQPDRNFGTDGIAVLEGPASTKVSIGPLVVSKKGILTVALTMTKREGAAALFARFDAKGKRLPWSRTTARSVAKVDDDFLVYPLETDRELQLRAMRIDGERVSTFGFSMPKDAATDVPLKWKLWQVTE